MTWDKIWSINSKILNTIATRFMSISKVKTANITLTNVDDVVEKMEKFLIKRVRFMVLFR